MGSQLVSGPFRYILQIAKLFKKTEQDMKKLENILMVLHKDILSNHSWKNVEPSTEEIASLDARIKAEKAIIISSKGPLKANFPNKVQTKTTEPNNIQTSVITPRNLSELNLENHPHWFVRVAEFYVSVANAFTDLRKFLKNICKLYAREMIMCVRYYKENVENVSNILDKDIQKVIQILRQNYEKKIDELTSVIRLCEQQRTTLSENKMKFLSEIEVNTVEIICIKETTSKLLPSITIQQEILETANKKETEIRKTFQKGQKRFNLLKRTKFKMLKLNSRAVASRNSFLRELNKINVKLNKLIEVAQSEGKKVLKELHQGENIEAAVTKNKNLKNKTTFLRKKIQESLSNLKKTLEQICDLEKKFPSLETDEKTTIFELQSACVISHKLHSDLKSKLASNIKKLQNILYVGRLKTNGSIMTIESQINIAEKFFNDMSNKVECLQDSFMDLCDQLDIAVNAQEELKSILDETEGLLMESEVNLLMLEDGNRNIIGKERNEKLNLTAKEVEDLIKESVTVSALRNANELEILKNHMTYKQRTLLDLRKKESLLQRNIMTIKCRKHCLKSSVIAVSHAYISVMMLPVSVSPPGEKVYDLSLLNDGNLRRSRMPDILMTGSRCSIDSSLKRNPRDQSSRSIHKRKKTRTWTKFENSLRKSLISELRRVMKVE